MEPGCLIAPLFSLTYYTFLFLLFGHAEVRKVEGLGLV